MHQVYIPYISSIRISDRIFAYTQGMEYSASSGVINVAMVAALVLIYMYSEAHAPNQTWPRSIAEILRDERYCAAAELHRALPSAPRRLAFNVAAEAL